MPFRNVLQWATWPRLEVYRYLRARSRGLSIHELEDWILQDADHRVIYEAKACKCKPYEKFDIFTDCWAATLTECWSVWLRSKRSVVRIHSGVPLQHIRVRIGYALPVGLEVLLAPFSLRHHRRAILRRTGIHAAAS